MSRKAAWCDHAQPRKPRRRRSEMHGMNLNLAWNSSGVSSPETPTMRCCTGKARRARRAAPQAVSMEINTSW